MITASAPNASALNTSTPLRIPPSTNIFIESPTASAISSRTSAVAGHWSSTRPPWFDTTIADAPASFAFNAPLTVITPFTINGVPAIFAIWRSSSTVLLPAGGSIFLRNGSPAASISIATARAFDSCTISIFPAITSRFHGFTVGIPIPSVFLIAFVAATITLLSTPSPVNAAIPYFAQEDTRISLYATSSRQSP